jgi:hypothetical protein
MNWKAFGRKRSCPNRGTTIPTLKDRKFTKTLRIVGVPAEIRIEHLPNTNLELCRYPDLLGLPHVDPYTRNGRGACSDPVMVTLNRAFRT